MRRHPPGLTAALLIPVWLAVAGTGTGAAVTHDVDIVGFAFDPATVTIQAGDTVRWTNQDLVSHTSTSDTGVWDSPLLANGESFEFIFVDAGDFPYHCTPHPFMLGAVVVEDLIAVEEQVVNAPPAARIAAAPNPMFASTSLTYDLPVATSVRLVVHDATGRLVAELLDGPQAAGEHAVAWDGRLATGALASTGVYFAHLIAGTEVRAVKLVIVR